MTPQGETPGGVIRIGIPGLNEPAEEIGAGDTGWMAWAALAGWVACSWVFMLAMCKAAAKGDEMPSPPQSDQTGAVVALDSFRQKEIVR